MIKRKGDLPTMKPLIGIMATIHDIKDIPGFTRLNNTYVISVSQAGGVPIVIPTRLTDEERTRIVDLCDGFLFSGGIDITPSFFGEDAHEKTGESHYALDQLQLSLMKDVIKTRKPLLGICRGHQVLNVACGGSLYQDLSESPGVYIKHRQETPQGDVSHKITIDPDSVLARFLGTEIMVNSYHHQSVKKPGSNIKITAHSADGIVEAIELTDYPFGIGVQWHPEVMAAVGDTSMCPLFEAFVKACKN